MTKAVTKSEAEPITLETREIRNAMPPEAARLIDETNSRMVRGAPSGIGAAVCRRHTVSASTSSTTGKHTICVGHRAGITGCKSAATMCLWPPLRALSRICFSTTDCENVGRAKLQRQVSPGRAVFRIFCPTSSPLTRFGGQGLFASERHVHFLRWGDLHPQGTPPRVRPH
jgi:hypothetical protein